MTAPDTPTYIMTESNYWTKLRTLLTNRVYAWKIATSYVKGIPDWWGSGSLLDLWVENKRIQGDGNPPAMLDLTDEKKYLTAHQKLWLCGRHKEGRRVGVIVFSKVGHLYLPGLAFQNPISKLEFLDKAMSNKELADLLVNILGELPIEDQKG